MELSILNKDIIKKEDIKNTVDGVMYQINEGTMNPLEVASRIKILEDLSKALKSSVQPCAISELQKYGKDELVKFTGLEINVKSRKGTLDYIQDNEYKRLKEKLDERKKLLDDAYTQHQKGNDLIINDEVIPVVSIKSHGSEYLTFKFE